MLLCVVTYCMVRRRDITVLFRSALYFCGRSYISQFWDDLLLQLFIAGKEGVAVGPLLFKHTCVMVCFGTPRATVPPPFSMHGLHLRCPQHRFECSKWRCQHCDIKSIISLCCNDVMNPYKRSHPDQDAVLWLPTTNRTVSCVCATMCSPRTVPEVLTVFLVK